MPLGGNAQVTINVGARLQVLQSSVNEIQKILDKLQPNSTGFKNLQTILNQITREMDRLQVQASKPFGSQNQFNQTEKTLDKIEDSLNNAQIALGRISFKDLKLSPDQEQQFKDLRNDIAEAKKALDSFKNEQKIELFKNADFKKFADSIDSNLIKKNFSEVAQAVSGESERITSEISKLTSKINQASKEISVGENVEKFTGFLDKDKTIKKQFEQFFTQTEQGLKFKPKQQNAFYEYLKEYFSLNDQQLNALKKLSAQKVQEVMTQEGYFEPQLKKAKNAATRQVSYNTQMTGLRTQADAAAAAMGTVETAEEKIAEQSSATESTVRALEERIRQLELQLTGAVQAAPEMKNGIAGITGELNSMKTSLEQANVQFLQLQRQRQTFESIKSAIVNFMGFNQVLNITRNAVRAAIDHIKELDTTMNGIAIVTDMTTADLWKQVDAYSAMAQNFGVTIQGAYEVSKIYYQAGYEANDVLTLTNETLKLSKISGLDYATTTDYMMTAMRGFKLEMEDASRVVDVYSNLAANTAVSQQELAEAMTRTASSMESVGATFEETSAMIATMVAVTRESANNIGSAMKSIASRYGELTKDPAALLDAEGEAMSFNKVDTALKSVGITLQTTDHQFRDFTDVIIELAQKWDTLDSAQQRYIATQFAGNRQQSRFLALVSNIDLLQENIANAENSEDVGTLQALKAMDSLESKINQVQVAYQQFYTTIGIESAWKGFLDGAKNVIDTLNSLPKLFGKVPVAAVTIILNAIGLVKNALISGLSNIVGIVGNSLKEVEQTSEKAANEAQQQGKNWAENLAQGIQSGAKKIAQSAKDVWDGANFWGNNQSKYTSYNKEQGAFLNNWDNSISQLLKMPKDGGLKGGTKEWKQSYDELRTSLKDFNIELPESSGRTKDLRKALESVTPKIHSMAENFNNASMSIQNHQKNILKAANTFSELGMGLSSISLLFNNGTSAGSAFTGVMMMLGGVLTGISAIMKGMQGASGWIGLAFTAITTIISGVSLAWETSEEKIERLNKEAEELNNKAKEAKANYSTLQRSVDKLDELEKKRHESAQAAEEYQTAVDELASSYPELINGINELGEITIDTASADRILAEAREKAAKATRDAAKAEAKSLEEKISEQEEQLEADRSYARMNLTQGSFIRTFQNVSSNGDLSDETLSYVLQQELSVDDIDENLISNFRDYLEAVFSDNKNQSVESFNTLVSAAKIFFENINKLAEDTEGYELSQELFSPIFEGYKELQSLQDSLRGQAKIDFLSIIDAQNSDNKINSKFLKSSGLRAFLAQDIYDNFEQSGMTLDEYEQAEGTRLVEADNQWLEWYKKLGEEKQELLDTMFSDSDIYSADDIISSLGIDDTLKSTVINYYAEISEFYKTSTEEILKELEVGFKGQEVYKYTKQDLNFWGSVNTEYNRLIKAGLETRADAFKDAQNQVFGEINQIAKDDAISARRIKQVILDNGMSTKEGLEESLKYLESQGYKKNDKIYDSLVQAYDALIENLSIGLQANLSSMGKELDDSLSELDKLKSGMDFEEVSNFLDKVKNLDVGIGIEDFVDKDGKLVLTEDAFETYWTAFQEKNLAIGDKWIALYDNLLAGTDYDYNIEQGFNKEYIKEALANNDENLKILAESLGVTIDDETDIDTIVNNLTQAADNYREWFELLQNLSNKAKEGAKKTIDRAKGIYKNYEFDTNYTVNELKEIAKDIKLDPNSDEYAIKSSLNSAYSNLISDVLSKGFQNINLKDYEGLKDQGKDINFDNITYKNFIKEYVDFTGKSTEEINALIVQAMEKDIASTTGAAQDALRDIDFYSPTSALASRDTLQKLADALGVRIEELYDGYIESLDQYSVDVSKIPLDKITNSADILFDSINSVINSITDYINNGLSGKLKAADVTNLNAQLERYGIQQLSAADFTRTKAGLQLSEQAAFRLYEDLRKIDGIQSQITFNDLAQSLKETNEHYKDFSSIIARINELDSKPSSARSKEYERELRIAKEIAAVRLTTDGGGFNFMSNELPAGMQNPIDYIDSWGKAFKALNEAATATGDSKNLIDATAFYNIVNELNNLAAIGDDIEFMGYTLDGSLESASELIQKGFNSLKNIDGEGTKVDLSNFGVDFASGADQMNANIEKGIHELAASQVAMLDAMIQLLETIVAMEELGDIDVDSDNLLSFDEFVDTTTDVPLFTEKYQKWRDSILQAINPDDIEHYNEDIANALNTVKVNGETLKDIINKSAKDFTQNDAQILNALYQAAKSNNWNLDNIAASMKEVLLGSGLEGTIEVDDMKFAIKYGQVFEIDSDNKVLDNNGKVHNTIEEAALENAKSLISGSKEKIEDAVEVAYDESGNIVATFKINEGVNLEVVQTPSGETTYRINGENYSSQSAALFAYYQSLNTEEQNKYSSYQDFILSITGEIIPEITVANENELKGATQDKINELAQALISGTTSQVKTAAATVGIAIDVEGELTAEQRKQIAELAGIESKNVALNITANYTGDSAKALGELLEKDPIEIDATVNITDVNDESGKLNVGEDGKVKITDLTASGLGTITLNDCEFSVVDGTAKITKDGNQIAFIPLENLEATGIGELPESNCTFTYVPGEGITISNGIVSVTIPEEVLRGTGSLNTNNTEVKYDGDAPKVSNEEIDVPLDNYLKGTGTLTSGACSIIYQGDVPYVSFENGALNIPLNDYLKAGGTLTKDNCHIVYNAGIDKLDVYDENNQLLGAIPVPLDFESTDGVLENVQVTFSEKGLEIIKDGKSITGGPIPLEDLTAEGTGDLLSLALQWLGGKENIDTSKVIPTDGLNLGATTATVKVTQITPEIEEAVRNDLLNRINKTIATAPEWPKANVSAVTKPSTVVNMLSNTPDHIIQNKVVEAQVKVDTEEAKKKLESVKQKNEDVHDTITGTTSKVNVDNSEANSKLNTTESEAYQTKNALNSVKGTGFFNNSQIISAIQQVINKVREGISALSNLSSTTASVTVSTSSGAGSGRDPYRYVRGLATGNVALAKGHQTLLGELGPELYVTGGHYYVAGQNGAEFVNLPDDAIVFNHLQTERLLKNGSAGRGKAVGGEKRAIAHAKGNAEGPAMASASAALAALKQIRAMWDSMLHASLSDLGSKAGLGKKTGGGGNDKGQTVKLDSGYIRDLERWYNLLRQIDRLEQDINYEEKLRSKLQADTVANGELIYESQRRTYEMLQRELDDRVELASLKKGYYEQRMAEIQAGPWGQLFYFNEEGVPQMKNLQFLADVFASSDEGGAVHSAREQYAMLQQAGFGSLLQYKEDGSIIEWTDDEGKPREEAYKEAVEAFSAKLDAQTEEVNSLREDYIEEMGNILDLQTQQNEILTQIRENTIAVEQEVLKAIEDSRKREIDELQKQRDVLSDSTDKFVDGLTDSLNKEREMYNSQQEDTELLQMRRQLAILQRSGGPASQIRSLQQQIRQREQEAYFEEQENQINAIKEASDLQLERLDAQISLMQETLEYQKAQGLLWDQVHEVMQGTHQEITQFVTGNNSEWWAKSASQTQNDLVELDNKIGQWVAHRDDISALGETMKNAISNGIAAITSVVAKVSESQSYTVSGTGSYVLPSSNSSNTGSYSGGTSSGANQSKPKTNNISKTTSVTPKATSTNHGYSFAFNGAQYSNSGYSSASEAANAAQARFNSMVSGMQIPSWQVKKFQEVFSGSLKVYKKGGLIDYTGPAWVDGTKKKPEGILNAEQLDMLRNSVLTRSNPIAALIADYSDSVRGTANSNTYNTIDRGESTVIENAQVVMNVSKMSNDYDARQAGRAALDEMIRISRKTKPTGVSRR